MSGLVDAMRGLADAAAALDSRWVLLAFLIVVNVWAIGLVVASAAAARDKWLWTLVILVLPILGCIFWYVMGPKPDLVRADESDSAAREKPGAG